MSGADDYDNVFKFKRDGNSKSGPLILSPARRIDPTSIPPRPWLYGTHILRGFVTVVVAPGGTGKSAYLMAVALCMALNRSLLGEHVFMQANAAVFNLEDPMVELERRLAALVMRHKINWDDLEGRYFLNSGDDRGLTIAQIDDDGFTVIYPDEEKLIEELIRNNIGVLFVDPFAESHSLEENSNPHMVRAAKAWRRVARAANCAIVLSHHVRKGAVTDIDAARGAKALTDSARAGLLLSPMSEPEAEQFGIIDTERWQYIRLDDAKVNLAPRASKARWYRLEQVWLGNCSPEYPNGDKVAAVAAWEPPSTLGKTSSEDLNRVLDRLAAGLEPGILYAPTRRGATDRWAGNVLMEELDMNEAQATDAISIWLRSGLLVKTKYYDQHQRKNPVGVMVDNSKRPS